MDTTTLGLWLGLGVISALCSGLWLRILDLGSRRMVAGISIGTGIGAMLLVYGLVWLGDVARWGVGLVMAAALLAVLVAPNRWFGIRKAAESDAEKE